MYLQYDMKRWILIVVFACVALYLMALGILYLFQERLIFFPQKLARDHRFAFPRDFEERSFRMKDGVRLNALLFRAPQRKGLIFYLHGNAGSLDSWGGVATLYTDLGYDLLLLDYRGFGKSEGRISSEDQLHSDVRQVYDSLKQHYKEADIILLGYSIGTGPAARLAAETHAGRLILQAPYYNMATLMKQFYPVIPPFILKYRFETNKYLPVCSMPVAIFHGDRDAVIHYSSALKLKALFKPSDTLIILRGVGHNGMSDHPDYQAALSNLLQ